MANDKTRKPPKPAPSKRPTTIDLKATEIRAAAKAAPAKPQEWPQAKPQSNADPRPEAQSAAGSGGEPPPRAEPDFLRDLAARIPENLPWPLIAAGVAGAVLFFAIGIGAGHWLSRDMTKVAETKVAEAPAPVAPPQPAVAPELLDRLAKLEAAVAAPRAPDPELVARIAAAEASMKTAADEAAQKAPAASPEQSRAELEAVISRLAAIEAVSRANQTEIAKRAETSVDDARSRLAITALSLRNAVESGAPFAAELSALRALSGDAKSIAALEPFAEGGVPTAASLGRELQAAMPAIWKAAQSNEPADGSFLERLQANAGKIVRVRPAGEALGDDAPSVKSRLETRAGNADIRGALAELSKLPGDARAPALGWIKKAEARNAALAAAQTLAQTALAALAKPGS